MTHQELKILESVAERAREASRKKTRWEDIADRLKQARHLRLFIGPQECDELSALRGDSQVLEAIEGVCRQRSAAAAAEMEAIELPRFGDPEGQARELDEAVARARAC